jgi:DNA-binding LacI/PurR family transcriptional regulator
VFVPDNYRGGDLATVTGFVEGVSRAPARLGARATVIRHNETSRMVVEKLTELFEDRDQPTAFLMTAPEYVYSLICFVQRRGFRIPEDVSIITRDPDPSFRLMIPTIAHYDFARQAYGRAFSRLMLKLVREGHLAPKPRLIELEYTEGQSVARHSP